MKIGFNIHAMAGVCLARGVANSGFPGLIPLRSEELDSRNNVNPSPPDHRAVLTVFSVRSASTIGADLGQQLAIRLAIVTHRKIA